MAGSLQNRKLLAVFLTLLWTLPIPALADSDSEASSDDEYEYADDSEESEDAYDYGLDEGDPDESAPDDDASPPVNRWQRAGEMTFDLLMLRPISVAGAVAGFGFFMASMPFVVFTDQLEVTRDLFMGIPGEYAFQRAIGEI